MYDILIFILISVSALYIYAKMVQNKPKNPIPVSIPEPTYTKPKQLCPNPVDDRVAKCWFHPKFKQYRCQHEDKYGIRTEVDESCCVPNCKTVDKIAKKFFGKRKPKSIEPITGKSYFCFDQFKEECYAKPYNFARYSENRCPTNSTTTNTPGKMYKTLGQCNANLRYKTYTKDQCLKHANMGWCTDDKGKGQCVRGTPIGPNNPSKYNCIADNSLSGKNAYIYGKTDPFILNKPGTWSP